MTGERVGAIIGGGFGTAFVLINAGELPPPWPPLTWLLGLGMAAASLRLIIVGQSSRTGARPPRSALHVYAISVIAEVLAIPAGAIALRAVDSAELTMTWVTFVVGVHFLPFAHAFGRQHFLVLGWLLIALAVGGSGMAVTVGVGWARVAAVIAGFVLLGFSMFADRGPTGTRHWVVNN